MSLDLPGASLDVEENGLGLIATPPTDICVVMGCCSSGPEASSPLSAEYISKPVSFGNLADFTAARGCGPGVKAAAYMHAKTGSSFVFVRLPKTAREATTSAVDISELTDAGLDPSVSGTPNDTYAVIVEFTASGTTGIAGIEYMYSLDGGVTYTDAIELGTGLDIELDETGLTITLITGQTVNEGDFFSFTTRAASEAILAVTATVDDATTSEIAVEGTPEDAYEAIVEIVAGGTIGEPGIVYRYSLDGGRSYTRNLNLGADDTIALLDGTEDSGLLVTFTAGDVTALDKIEFRTTAPEAQDSDIVAAHEALRTSNLAWSFIHVIGNSNATTAGSVQSKLDELAGRSIYTWAALSARERGYYEPDEDWRTELVDDVAELGASRISMGVGMRRITCPITGRRNRRPIMWIVVPRVISRPLQEDPGRVATGALSADVEIANDDAIDEHDALLNPDLHGARYVTLRTYEELDGLYITRGNMMATEGTDVVRIPLRRVLDLGSLVFRRAMVRQLENDIFVNPATYPIVERRGCIREVDAVAIEREIKSALEDELTALGRASDVSVLLSRTDAVLTNGGKLTCKVRITPLGYIDQFDGSIAFANPKLTALQAA